MPRQLRDARQRLLWELARNGHARGFRQLYRELSVPVLRYLTSRLRSSAEAEDVASEVFQKVVTFLDKYDPERGSVQAWVMTLARNTLIDHLRRQRPTEPMESVADTLADGAPDALERLVEEEDARFAHGIMRRYPPEVREMFSLHFAHGLPYRDIATTMGMSEAAVKQRFARTLRELRQAWGTRKRESSSREHDSGVEKTPALSRQGSVADSPRAT
jgi:RNA polymerase sigma-70 factor (ECF subfamily)